MRKQLEKWKQAGRLSSVMNRKFTQELRAKYSYFQMCKDKGSEHSQTLVIVKKKKKKGNKEGRKGMQEITVDTKTGNIGW